MESADAVVIGAGRPRDTLRERIVAAAVELLASGGRDSLTTRAVAAAAGVQAPAIYRLFGDKHGLLDAAAEHGYATYLAGKDLRPGVFDPIERLRAGWDLHVEFGLSNPALYALMYGDPTTAGDSSAAQRSEQVLRGHLQQLAAAGRLRVTEERAMNLMQATARGTTLTLLAMPPERRDQGLSEQARDAVLAAITTDTPVLDQPGSRAAAIALRAVLPDIASLSTHERNLLGDWLDRITAD